MQGSFDRLVEKLKQLDEQEAQKREKRTKVREALARCIASCALTPEQFARIEAEIHQVEDIEASAPLMAKALGSHARPRPSAQEIIRNGWFSELPRAPFQRAAWR